MVRGKLNKLASIKNGNRYKIYKRSKTTATSKLATYKANIKMIYKEDIIEAEPFSQRYPQNRDKLEAKYAKYC